MLESLRYSPICLGLALTLAVTISSAGGHAASETTPGTGAQEGAFRTDSGEDAPVSVALTLVVRLSNPQENLPADVPVVPLDYNGRIRILAHVTEVAAGESPWPQGSDVAFVVHSPSRTFGDGGDGGDGFEGKLYELTLKPAGENPWGLKWELAAVREDPAEEGPP